MVEYKAQSSYTQIVNIFGKKPIYLDYAALTPIDSEVQDYMNELYDASVGNPSSLHSFGVKAKKVLDESRKKVAECIHAHPDEIFFTSSATEANRIALSAGSRVLMSPIEHHSIFQYAQNPSFFEIEKSGKIIIPKDIKNADLISLQWVNNEIGTIQPVYEVGNLAKEKNILYHIDASQAPITQEIDMQKVKANFLTLGGNKIYGPRGVGVLYIRRGTPFTMPHQSTPNIPAIGGFALALAKVTKNREKNVAHLNKLNTLLPFMANGDHRSPHILSVTFPNIDAEYLVLQLDAKGIAVSTKSSCLRDEEESYVLKAIAVESKNTIRFSFGIHTTERDIKQLMQALEQLGVIRG